MIAPKKQFKSIDEYISAYPKAVALKLRTITEIVESKAPEAEKIISYGMPAFKLNGRLVYYAAFKNHIGLYPMASGVKAFKKELTKYKTATGSIQFPHDKPLPLALIKKIISFRVKENRMKGRN